MLVLHWLQLRFQTGRHQILAPRPSADLARLREELKELSEAAKLAPEEALSDLIELVDRIKGDLTQIRRPQGLPRTGTRPMTRRRAAPRVEQPAAHRIAQRLLQSGLSVERVSTKTMLPETLVRSFMPLLVCEVADEATPRHTVPNIERSQELL